MGKKNMDVGLAIRYWRKAKGLSQGQIARQNQWERSYVSNLERGKIRNPGLETVLMLIDALGISANDFVGVGLGKFAGSHDLGIDSVKDKDHDESHED